MIVRAQAKPVPQSRAAALAAKALDYYEIGKPRIMYLLLFTTAAAAIMAAHGLPRLDVLGWTLLAGALAALSSGTLNCVYDADIDAKMRRTQDRPIPAGRMTIFAATKHAVVIGSISFAIFYLRVNPLAAWLSLAGSVFYVVIYTMLLKRRTPQNIVIGGAAGAVAPLVGWAAVTGTIGAPALALFVIIFLWTPPHFWSLALIAETDYARAGIPMLPNVAGERRTKIEILVYSIVLAAVTIALYPLGVMGLPYALGAALLGVLLVGFSIRTMRDASNAAARALFRFSLLYLALLCAIMVIDRVIS